MSEEIQNTESKSSYRSIFKATSLFGGVQVYQILIAIIKSKFVAVLLGPAGVGVQGLLTSATDIVKQITSLGLSQSAVRDVSEANGTGDYHRVSLIVTVLRRVVWVTGIAGLVAVIVLSPLLSKWSFGNNDYVIPFILLSVILLMDQLSAGQKVILQGMRKLKDLAKASAIGATFGLLVSIPLYYWLGIKGIVPTLILHSATSLLLSWYFSRKIKVEHVDVNAKTVLKESSLMVKMGIALSISGVMVSACSYILRGYIRSIGGVEEVGLYQAGFVIMSSYVGLIFNAMTTDYYPRLSAVSKDNVECAKTVNQQGEVAALIMAPLLIICLVFMPLVIRIIYSDRFLPANDYILWSVMGMMFKMMSWVIAYIFVAKAETKLFMINETITNIYTLILNILFYKWLGLTGLGMSFAVSYLIYTIQVYVIARHRYGFRLTSDFAKLYSVLLSLVILCLVIVKCFHGLTSYILGGVVILLAGYLSVKGLQERMDILSALKKFKK